MAQNKNDLITLINSNLANNTSADISPTDVREVVTQIMDSSINTAETSAQSVAGSVNFTGGITKAGATMLTSVKEVDIIRAHSVAVSQLPSGLGVAKKVEFGAAQSFTRLSLSAAGNLTCNVTGTYSIRVKLQKGRTGSSGTSALMSRILVNGVQVGVSAVALLTSPDVAFATESKVNVPLTAGDVFTVEIIRDNTGSDFGGLYSKSSAHGWTIAPSALMVASYIEGS